MARAIDADALLKDSDKREGAYGLIFSAEDIRNAPTIEAESVKHCKWVFAPDTGPFGRGTWVCSGCGKPNHNILVMALSDPNTGVTYRRAPYTFDGHQFCPNCGASMDD